MARARHASSSICAGAVSGGASIVERGSGALSPSSLRHARLSSPEPGGAEKIMCNCVCITGARPTQFPLLDGAIAGRMCSVWTRGSMYGYRPLNDVPQGSISHHPSTPPPRLPAGPSDSIVSDQLGPLANGHTAL